MSMSTSNGSYDLRQRINDYQTTSYSTSKITMTQNYSNHFSTPSKSSINYRQNAHSSEESDEEPLSKYVKKSTKTRQMIESDESEYDLDENYANGVAKTVKNEWFLVKMFKKLTYNFGFILYWAIVNYIVLEKWVLDRSGGPGLRRSSAKYTHSYGEGGKTRKIWWKSYNFLIPALILGLLLLLYFTGFDVVKLKSVLSSPFDLISSSIGLIFSASLNFLSSSLSLLNFTSLFQSSNPSLPPISVENSLSSSPPPYETPQEFEINEIINNNNYQNEKIEENESKYSEHETNIVENSDSIHDKNTINHNGRSLKRSADEFDNYLNLKKEENLLQKESLIDEILNKDLRSILNLNNQNNPNNNLNNLVNFDNSNGVTLSSLFSLISSLSQQIELLKNQGIEKEKLNAGTLNLVNGRVREDLENFKIRIEERIEEILLKFKHNEEVVKIREEEMERKILSRFNELELKLRKELKAEYDDHVSMLVKKEFSLAYAHSKTELNYEISNGLSIDEVEELIRRRIQIYDEDKTGKADLALESAGASIVSTRCTKQSDFIGSTHYVFGIPIWYPSNSPRKIIQPGSMPGDCWSFQGGEGFAVIKLVGPSKITGFTIEHLSKIISPLGHINSAPKKFQVVGHLEFEDPESEFLFGEYEYKDNGTPIQYFEPQNKTDVFYPYVELKVLSNHGSVSYTCIYRFRVHGYLESWAALHHS